MVVAETLPKEPVDDNDILICPLPVIFVNSNSPLSILLPVPSFFVTLVEKLPLSAFKFVTRVENEALSACKLFISLAKLALATAKAPLICVAICAEPDRAPLNIPVNDVADTLSTIFNLPNEPVEAAEPLNIVLTTSVFPSL